MMSEIEGIKKFTRSVFNKSRYALALTVMAALLGLYSFPGGAIAQGSPVLSYFSPTGGPGGTEVTVVGDNFTNNNHFDMKVTLNETQAQILRMTDRELVFVVPPEATTGKIKLETSAGAVTTADSFIVSSLTVRLKPSRINIFPDYFRQISATVIGSAEQGIVWSVNGVEGGNETLGTVTQANPATYHAPAQIPGISPVLVTAVSVANPAVRATARVNLIDGTGPLVDIDLPPADPADYTVDEVIYQPLSRTRIMVLLQPGANLGSIQTLLSTINAEVIGTIPEINLVTVQIPDSGNLDDVKQAVSTLESSPSVVSAAHDSLLETKMIPPEPSGDSRVLEGTNLNPYATKDIWVYTVKPSGGNWGLEYANFPPAWNLYHYIRKQGRVVDVGVVDSAVDFSHPDLPRSIVTREAGGNQTPGDHGTHVAGIIGAKWDDVGINGASPFVRIYNQPTGNLQYTTFGGLNQSIGTMLNDTMRQLVRKRATVRVINFSQGYDWFNAQKRGVCIDRSVPPDGDCADPGDIEIEGRYRYEWDNAAGDVRIFDAPATVDNNPAQQRLVESQGRIALAIANYINDLKHPESGRKMIIVAAACNERYNFSLEMHSAPAPGAVDRAMQWNTISARFASPFTWAAYNGASNVIVVEALQPSDDRSVMNRSSFSNFAATWPGPTYGVSAPGEGILSAIAHKSTVGGDRYNNVYQQMSGTSMAAPHVTGLIAYLYAVDPDLTIDNITEILRRSSRASTTSAPAIDAFRAVMYIDEIHKDNPSKRKWVKKALLNIDDGTVDGNDRTVAYDEHGTGLTPPDMRINMSDFRRFRDAYLQVLSRDAHFNAKDSPKRDLNGDGVVKPGGDENVYPRFDFNGDGVISLRDLEEMADPELWNDEVIDDAGLTPEQLFEKLSRLLISGDVKLDGDALFNDPEIDTIKVQAKVELAPGVFEIYKLTITPDDVKGAGGKDDKRKILTLPADKPIQLWATAYKGAERKYFLLPPDAPKEFQVLEGEDRVLKLGKVNVSLGAESFTASYGDKVILDVKMDVDGIAVEFDINRYEVAFTISPSLGSIAKTVDGYQLTVANTIGRFPIKAVVSTKDGEVVNPFDKPFISSQATVRTAVIKAPGGFALDPAGNMYVSDTEDGSITIIPPGGTGLRFIQGLNRPGDVEVDARGRSIIVAEAGGKISRHYFGLSGRVSDTAGNLLVGASIYLETPSGTLPGEASKVNRYRTNVNGHFHIFGLLAPEMGADPVKIAVTIEYQGKTQAFELELESVGQTIRDFVFNP